MSVRQHALDIETYYVHRSMQQFHIPRARLIEVDEFFDGDLSPMKREWISNDPLMVSQVIPFLKSVFSKREWLGWCAVIWHVPQLWLWFYPKPSKSLQSPTITQPQDSDMVAFADAICGLSWKEAYVLLAAMSNAGATFSFDNMGIVGEVVTLQAEMGWVRVFPLLPILAMGASVSEIREYIIEGVDATLVISVLNKSGLLA